MSIKVVISDVGGVVIHSGDTDKLRSWEKRLRLEKGEIAKLLHVVGPAEEATLGLVTADEMWRSLQKKFALTVQELEVLRKDFYTVDKLNNEFYTFMKEVKKTHRTALLSNAW